MRSLQASIGQRWRKMMFGGSLLLLGLTGFDLPTSRAELRNSGARVQVHQRQDGKATVPVPGRRDNPPSYYPDNDSGYPSGNAGDESSRSGSLPAGGLPYGVSANVLPWNQPGFEEYDSLPRRPFDSSVYSPEKYVVKVTTLRPAARVSQPTAAMLIAHLPENAQFWVEEVRTRLGGPTRYFQSPRLLPGRKYHYTVRAVWIEDSHWVSQTRIVPVQAGLIQTIYLQASPKISPPVHPEKTLSGPR